MKWRRITRETGLIEWVCEHGVGHPDMDSVHKMGNEWGIHGCDGCCSLEDFPGKSKVGLMTKLQETYNKVEYKRPTGTKTLTEGVK